MPNFYAPVMYLTPQNINGKINAGSLSLIPRQWSTSMFDVASLYTNHRVHMPYELVSVFLDRCNFEFRVSENSLDEAKSKLQVLRAMLYLEHSSPFIMPFICTHSVNEYAGINKRESTLLRNDLPDELKDGPKSPDTTIEIWPFDRTMGVISRERLHINKERFERSVTSIDKWQKIKSNRPILNTIQDGLISAPFIWDIPQSILHIWTNIEALFPNVRDEVSFRIALYLSQLSSSDSKKRDYFRMAKKAYNTRSSIAHGSSRKIKDDDWDIAWNLLGDACRSILKREVLPNEDQLLDELLS